MTAFQDTEDFKAGFADDAPEDVQRFTLVFNGDIGDVKGNVFKTETPFGIARAASVGDALAIKDELLAALTALEAVLDFSEPASDDKPIIFDDWSALNKAFDAARVAIAHAEGRS